MASVAKATAVSKPNVFVVSDDVVVDRLRHANERNPQARELVRDGERPVAADHDERIESHPVEHLDDARRVVVFALRRFDPVGEWIAAIDRAQNRATAAEDAGHVLRRHHPGAIGLDEAIEAVFQPDDLDPVVHAGLHDRTDDSVQAWSVAAPSKHTDSL